MHELDYGPPKDYLHPNVERFRVYVIGSMKNPLVKEVARELRELGFEVFDDWISPGPEADDCWLAYEKQRGRTFIEALKGFHAKHVFELDNTHLNRSDAGVLVLPAGKSGHMELGYLVGQGKFGYILLDKEPERYDIMYNLATDIFGDRAALYAELKKIRDVAWGNGGA